jgi:hypothetical protein
LVCAVSTGLPQHIPITTCRKSENPMQPVGKLVAMDDHCLLAGSERGMMENLVVLILGLYLGQRKQRAMPWTALRYSIPFKQAEARIVPWMRKYFEFCECLPDRLLLSGVMYPEPDNRSACYSL